jgi:hypothetical protein
MICLECVRSLEIRENRGRSSYTYIKKVCPICYDDYYINQGPKQNVAGVIFPIFFIIIAASMVATIPAFPGDSPIVLFFVFFFSIPSIMIIVSLYNLLIKMPQKRRECTIDKEQFLQSLHEEEDTHSILQHHHHEEATFKPPTNVRAPESDEKIIYCEECGAENHFEARFCLKCGHSLDQEKAIAKY